MRKVCLLGLFVALLALGGCSGAKLAKGPHLKWDYDPTTGRVSWNYQEMPQVMAHFDIYYENNNPPFYSTVTLNTPEYAIPDTPDKTGCGWQWWYVYTGVGRPSKYDPIPNPPESTILARGKTYACGSPGL